MKAIEAEQFEALLRSTTRWIDVRAPIEFAEGAIPGAVNLPLLEDSERHEVGLVYKNQGQQAAIELGHKLVSGPVREARLQAWLAELKAHPGALIYCFRGGLRSQTVQAWLNEAGCERPIVKGGYKALRRFLLSAIEEIPKQLEFKIISGPTGSGKTQFLKASGKPYIDLEGLAAHRGSAFGAVHGPQPSQANFENALAVKLLELAQVKEPVLVEDESRLIGHRTIPVNFYAKMKASRKHILEVPLGTRVENILREYVVESPLGAHGDLKTFDSFRSSVRAISRKLGGARAQEILVDLDFSQSEFTAGRGLDSNRVWIAKLLEWYYDPHYKFAHERTIAAT